jgi:class 3 adenylate cyclase
LSIRAGIHSGEVEIIGEAVRGVAVHQASRIAGVAGGDEILVSEATRMLSADGAFTFDARGPYVLKGLPGSHTLFAAGITEAIGPS